MLNPHDAVLHITIHTMQIDNKCTLHKSFYLILLQTSTGKCQNLIQECQLSEIKFKNEMNTLKNPKYLFHSQ